MVAREDPRCPVCARPFGRLSGMLRHVSNAADADHAAALQAQRDRALQARADGLSCKEAGALPDMWFGHDWIARLWRATYGETATEERHRTLLAERTRAHHAAHPDFNHLLRHRWSAPPGPANPFFGQTHGPAAKAAMSATHRGKTISDAQKAKFRAAHARRYPTQEAWSQEVKARFDRNPEAREKLRHARLNQRFLKSWTRPERAMAALLDQAGRAYDHHVPIGGIGIVDFLMGKTIIEVFGDYWHANPDRVTEPDGRQLAQRAKDQAKLAAYHALGYDIEVFWENDLLRRPDACATRLAGIFDGGHHEQLP